MKTKDHAYIIENRYKESMKDMGIQLGISLYHIRKYMIENRLKISEKACYKIRASSRKQHANKIKPWNWDAIE